MSCYASCVLVLATCCCDTFSTASNVLHSKWIKLIFIYDYRVLFTIEVMAANIIAVKFQYLPGQSAS